MIPPARARLPLFLLMGLVVPLLVGPGGPVGAAEDEEDLVGPAGAVVGRHYRQTGGGTDLGYDVREPLFGRFGELGGPAAVGYPASAPAASRWPAPSCTTRPAAPSA